jgi:hypothetical protein
MPKVGKDGKFQFVFVNIEGDQETLQEALRQVGTVLNHGLKPAPTRTLIAVPAPKTIGNGVHSENNTDSDIYEVLPEEPTDKEPLTAGDTNSKAAAKPKREKKAGRVPELLKEFDPNAAEVSMNDFFNHHDTNSQFNKYLVIAAWFKRYKNVDEITPSHIYTCYQLMKWQAPDNLSQPFNDMKRLRSYFERTQSGWAITIVGMNELDRQRKEAN